MGLNSKNILIYKKIFVFFQSFKSFRINGLSTSIPCDLITFWTVSVILLHLHLTPDGRVGGWAVKGLTGGNKLHTQLTKKDVTEHCDGRA